MKLSVKNMVCNRCIMMVRSELESFGLEPDAVRLGEVEIPRDLSLEEKRNLDRRFRELGFEILDDKKTRLIENIRTCIVQRIHYTEEPLKITFSEFLSNTFHQDYSALSKLFSEVQGITIEQYVIIQKIEKVKELLIYDELTLSEISDRLNYSSVSHLSKQFKKVTGQTPTQFKQVKENKRIPLDQL